MATNVSIIKEDDKSGKQKSVYPPLATTTSSQRTYERPPDTNYDKWVELYETDPIFGAAIDNEVDYIAGMGVTVKFHSLSKKGDEVSIFEAPEVVRAMRLSKVNKLIKMQIKDAILGGDGYLEIVRTKSGNIKAPVYKAVNIPPGKMRVLRDEHMNVLSYKQEVGGTDEPEFKPENIVHYKFHEVTGKGYGCATARRVIEASNILRNIGLDLAEFVGTKAFPPLLWILGSPEKPWDADDVAAFMAERTSVNPGDQIGVAGDIDAKPVGVADAALDVSKPMNFFASEIINGMQLPSALSTVIEVSNQFVAETQMAAFDIFINSVRNDLKELLEVELFDEMLTSHGYDDLYSEVIFEKHNWEKERVDVNNIIQLLNSKLYSVEYALHKLGDPVDEAQRGRIINDDITVDPSGTANGTDNLNQLDSSKGDNKDEDTDEDDGRAGSRRVNVTE